MLKCQLISEYILKDSLCQKNITHQDIASVQIRQFGTFRTLPNINV